MQKDDIRFDNTEVAFAPKSHADLRKARLLFATMMRPWMVKLAVVLTRFPLHVKLPVRGIIRSTIFQQFCGGESIEDCKDTIQKLGQYNVKTILDYSVEGESNESSYDQTKEEIVKICEAAKDDPNIPFSVVKLTGIGPSDLMAKAQAGEDLTEIEAAKLMFLRERTREIARVALDNGIMFMIDAEETWMQDTIDQISYELMREFNKDYAHVFNTYQLYRHDALERLKEDMAMARNEGFHLGAKLVRGAYMEKERERAQEKGYPSPIQPDKQATDHDFDEALRFCIENIDQMAVCSGTHNEKSSHLLCELIQDKGLPKDDPRVFFAQLLGMSDNISFNLAKAGYNVAKYVPYGPIEYVMPYLFRRAEENTAIAGQGGREYMWVKKKKSLKCS